MRLDRRRIARSLLMFAAITLLGAWPWPRAATAFSAVYSRVANLLLLDRIGFGQGGHAQLRPLEQPRARPGDHVVADTALVLSVDRAKGQLALGLSLRRDAYLPLVLVAAMTLAGWGTWSRKARSLLAGLALVFLYTLGATWLLVVWQFAVQMKGIYFLSSWAIAAVDLAQRMILLPPANRFIIPLLTGLALGWWQRPQPVTVSGCRAPAAHPVPD